MTLASECLPRRWRRSGARGSPAPLFMARRVWGRDDLDAIEALPPTISADQVKQRGLVAYTAIYAPTLR